MHVGQIYPRQKAFDRIDIAYSVREMTRAPTKVDAAETGVDALSLYERWKLWSA